MINPYNYISYVSQDYGGGDSIHAFDIPAFKNWHCQVTKNWYKVSPNGYNIPFSQTGLTTPNSVISIAFLYESLANHTNWRNIFRFTDNNEDINTNSRIPAVFTNYNNNNFLFAYDTNTSINDGFHSIVLPLNKPFLITIVITATTFTYYINKTLYSSYTYGSITGRNANTTLIIGDDLYPCDGNILIKDYTLYDGALSQTDVNNIYNNLTNMNSA
jgi:hypothetical protein